MCQSQTSLLLRDLSLVFSVACHWVNKAQWIFDHPKEPHSGMTYLGLLRKGFGSPTLSQWIRHWSAKATHPTLVATTAQLQFHQ